MEAFLTHLAVQGKVAASTQNQALKAIVFLYRLRHQDGAGAPGPQGRVDHVIYTHVLNRGGRGVRSPLDGVEV